MSCMTEDPEPSHSGVPGVTRLGEDDWRARRLPTIWTPGCTEGRDGRGAHISEFLCPSRFASDLAHSGIGCGFAARMAGRERACGQRQHAAVSAHWRLPLWCCEFGWAVAAGGWPVSLGR